MLSKLVDQLRTTFVLLIFFIILTGLIYPAIVTGIAQFIFPEKANGSLIYKNGIPTGSLFIGQSFADAKYFWGRPSATTPFPYNASHSSGSNLGPSNPELFKAVQARVNAFKKLDPKNNNLIPIDLVTTSASGLDPEISPFAAMYQIKRIAKARHISEAMVTQLIKDTMASRTLGILGEPRVNVLKLNLALDKLSSREG